MNELIKKDMHDIFAEILGISPDFDDDTLFIELVSLYLWANFRRISRRVLVY